MILSKISKAISSTRSNRIVDKKLSKISMSEYGIISDSNLSANASTIVNPFLFLQEVDEYIEDQEKLKEKGNQILICLNEIRFAMLSSALQEEHIVQMKQVLEIVSHKFHFQEFQQVVDDITLRLEVELAKLEMSLKK